jgi:hypothetical protein
MASPFATACRMSARLTARQLRQDAAAVRGKLSQELFLPQQLYTSHYTDILESQAFEPPLPPSQLKTSQCPPSHPQ